MTQPALVALPPLPDARHPLAGATVRIGRGRDAAVRVDHPLVEAQQALLLEREDGWWLTAAPGRVSLNGQPWQGEHRLEHGDRLTLAPGATLLYDSGVPQEAPRAPKGAMLPPSARRRRRVRIPALSLPSGRALAAWGAVLVVLALVGGFGWYAWKTTRETPVDTPDATALTEPQAIAFDSLLGVAYEHIERGQVLLEYRANAAALEEFATGIAAITASPLRDEPYVRERVEALRATVAEMYRARSLPVPGSYAAAKPKVALASTLRAALSVEQFAAGFRAIQETFRASFGKPLVVTGSDHSEHLSLYGRGGALDLRTSTLAPEQLRFVIDAARAKGIRVKDFSQDAILRAQIAAAIRAGVPERAGTGLHLHIDRFANRRDRYTVP